MKLSEKACIGSLAILHCWGTWLITRDGLTAQAMFDTTCFGIFSTLAVLAGEKVIKALGELKWGKGPESSQITGDKL